MLSTNMYIEYAFFKNTTIPFHCQQQSYSELRSPGRSYSTYLQYSLLSLKIVFDCAWYSQSPQEKLKTMLMQNFGGTRKSILVFFKKGLISLTLGLS